MYRHIKSYELRYTDVDAYDNLKLSSLLSILEESACMSADELGFGYKDITPLNIGFIIVNWYIKLNRNIKLGELLTVHTWPIKPKVLIFFRDFELYCGNEKVGVGTTRWCMINTATFAMIPISSYFKTGDFDSYNTQRSVEFNNWKIPEISEGKCRYSKVIAYSDYDHYFHTNNTKYADFLMDSFATAELADKSVESVQITYVKQCKEGEKIVVMRENAGDFELVEGRVDGELRVQMRIKFNVA